MDTLGRLSDYVLESTWRMLLLAILACGVVYGLVLYSDYPRRRKMPPRVKGWPIIAQYNDHLSSDIYLKHLKWHRKYGEFICDPIGFDGLFMVEFATACEKSDR